MHSRKKGFEALLVSVYKPFPGEEFRIKPKVTKRFTAEVCIKSMEFLGISQYEIDFSKERIDIWGDNRREVSRFKLNLQKIKMCIRNNSQQNKWK